MTQDTLEDFVVVGIDVARRTGLPLAAMRAAVDREKVGIVIERCRCPARHGVAGRAVVREIQRHVAGIGLLLELGLMAREAVLRRSCKHPVHMATRAGHALMRTQKRERRVVVIEGRRVPGRGRMAGQAVMREIAGHVVGVGYSRKVRLVAGIAVLRRAGEHPIGVALLANHGLVGTGQLKRCPAVIE